MTGPTSKESMPVTASPDETVTCGLTSFSMPSSTQVISPAEDTYDAEAPFLILKECITGFKTGKANLVPSDFCKIYRVCITGV